MATYLDILNSARAEYGATPLGVTAIGENTGDALQGVQAAKKAIQHFIQDSFDIDATEKIEEVSTVAATSVLTAPTGETWDSNVIKWIKYKKSGETALLKMALITPEDAEDYKLKTFQTNDPQYYYILGGVVNVLPVPTQVYTLVVSYQKIVPYITSSNITDTIVLPDSALLALQSGMYAYLRKANGDPEWQSYFAEFDLQKKKFFERNKHTYKRKGHNRFRMNYNYADRNL